MIKYKRMITKFIWGTARPKISYDRLISSFENGGQQLRDLIIINKSLKMAIPNKLMNKNIREFWHEFFEYQTGADASYIFSCNMNPKDVIKYMSVSLFQEVIR